MASLSSRYPPRNTLPRNSAKAVVQSMQRWSSWRDPAHQRNWPKRLSICMKSFDRLFPQASRDGESLVCLISIKSRGWLKQRIRSVGCYTKRLVHLANGDDCMTLKIESVAFAAGGEIPTHYTGEGADESPPLSWSGVPANTKSLAFIVDDPDAPDPAAPKMVWVHWLLYNLPPQTADLAAAIAPRDLPPGTLEGLNDWKRTG